MLPTRATNSLKEEIRQMRQNNLIVFLCLAVGGSVAAIDDLIWPDTSSAHGGGIDEYGCHRQNSDGTYHCHSGPLEGQSFPNRAAMLDALAAVPSPPSTSVPYDRNLYRHWIDADRDCQDTRQEVLIVESLQTTVLDDQGCRVASGRWFDPYTGQTFTDPGDLDIDHFIPLAEVHRSGGDRWTAQRREDYANDLAFHPDVLMAVSASANRSKGDRDPAEWLPPNTGYRCAYVETWVEVKATWRLNVDAGEKRAIEQVLGDECAAVPVPSPPASHAPIMDPSAFMIFPQVADGTFSDGGYYRTTISLSRKLGGDATCRLSLYGLDVDFGAGRGSGFTLTVPGDGFVSARTTGAGPLQTGYATVTCDEEVYGQLAYAAYDAPGKKIAEATVFPTEVEFSNYNIIVDGRDGARLGLAIANNTDISRTYDFTLRDPSGGTASTGSVTVPARSNVAQFLNDLISPPPAPWNVYLLEVRASDSSDFSMIGLRYTGLVFSTAPVN